MTKVPPTVSSYAATITLSSCSNMTSLFLSVCAPRGGVFARVGIPVIPVWCRYLTRLLPRGFPGRVHLRLTDLCTRRVALARMLSFLRSRSALPAGVAYKRLAWCLLQCLNLHWRIRGFLILGAPKLSPASGLRAGVDLFVLCPEEERPMYGRDFERGNRATVSKYLHVSRLSI